MSTKPKSYRNKDLSAEISRICRIPEKEAKKLTQIILEELVREIRKHKKLVIPRFGRFSLFAQKRVSSPFLPDKLHPPKSHKCWFKASKELKRYVYQDPDYKRTEFVRVVLRRIKILDKEGKVKQMKHKKDVLLNYLLSKPRLAQWADAHWGLPPDLRRKLLLARPMDGTGKCGTMD